MKNITIILFTLLCVSLFAQSNEDSLRQMSLEELMGLSVSTGSFLELDLYKSPLSMTTISSEQISVSGARHLSELLEIYVPGFQYMINKWNGTIWGMRGIVSDRNNKVIVLINGQKQNIQAYHGAATEYTLGILGDIDHIEVLRGPAGLVYGSGAIAGVINIVTKKKFENTSFGSVRFDSNLKNGIMGRTVEGGVYAKLKELHTLSFHAGFRSSEGIGLNNTKCFGRYELLNGVTAPATGNYTAGSAHSTPGNFLGSMDYSLGNFNLYARYTRQQDDMAAYYYPAPWGSEPDSGAETWIKDESYVYRETKNYHLGWTPHRKAHIRDNVSVGAGYYWDIGQDKLTLDGSVVGVTNRLINNEDVNSSEDVLITSGERRFEIGAHYLMKRFSKLQIAAGMEFGYELFGEDLEGRNEEWYWSLQNSRMEVREMLTPVTYRRGTIYAESEYRFNPKVALIGGVRFDSHTRAKSQWSPKGGVVYTPSSDHSFKFITQTSSNNADVLTYELSPSAISDWQYNIAYPYGKDADSVGLDSLKILMGNLVPPTSEEELHSIKPEKSYSFELATSHLFMNRLHLGSSFSYNMIRNLFSYNDILGRVVNLGKYDAFVMEIESGYKGKKLSVGGNVTVQMPVKVDNSPSPFSFPKFVPSWDTIRDEWVPTDTLPDGTYVGDSTLMHHFVANQVSEDGKYFNSLHTTTTKLYMDYKPFDYVTLHTDMRIFWGLLGRKAIHQEFIDNAGGDARFLNTAGSDGYLFDGYAPMTKWNASINFKLPRKFTVGLFVYDILGEIDNRHAVRWHQMAEKDQAEYYTVDQRSFAFRVKKEF